MKEAHASRDLSPWRHLVGASEDSLMLADMIERFREHHRDRVSSRTPEVFSCVMAAMLTATFSVECLVNDVLRQVVTDLNDDEAGEARWKKLERLSVKKKVQEICKRLEIESPLGAEPFQVLDDMLEFRARMVHGKAEVVAKTLPAHEVFGHKALSHEGLKTQWERDCSVQNATRFKDSAWAMAMWFVDNTGGKYGPRIATSQAWG